MRKRLTCLAIAAGFLLAPMASLAETDDVEAQLKQMQDRMSQLEDRLQATTDQLESSQAQVERQQEMIERSGIGEERVGASGLQGFFDRLQVGGWVAGSYTYNWQDPDGKQLGGFNSGDAGLYPLHPDANSFEMDQLWFELEHPVSEEHRAGFRADIVFGKTASILGGVFGTNGSSDGDFYGGDETDLYIHEAYVQYLAPVGEGAHFKFGIIPTLIGAEVPQAPYNLNITRGNVWTLLQPINHTGVTVAYPIAENGTFTIGFVNETRCFPACDVDLNKNKAVIGAFAWDMDTVGFQVSGTWGAADSGQFSSNPPPGRITPAGNDEYILDLIVNWDPTEKFSGYLNSTYINSDNSDEINGFSGYGVSLAGRYAFTEKFGFAMRGEWVDLDLERTATTGPNFQVWNVTGTFDYSLTDALMLRAEARYDVAREGSMGLQDIFFEGNTSSSFPTYDASRNDQLVGAIEVIYNF
jgi:hypothetical protein